LEAAVIAVQVEHDHARGLACSQHRIGERGVRPQARMTTREVVACLTPRGAGSAMGCLAGLWQLACPQAQRPEFDQ